MRHPVRWFNSAKVALKELEPFVRNGRHLQTGKPFRSMEGMRSREALANWLLCAVLNVGTQTERFYFSSDPTGGDGLIVDDQTGDAKPTEHVLVLRARDDETDHAETLILRQIGLKHTKGEAYASGKVLVVFLNAQGGAWHPNRVAKALPEQLYFLEVWVVGLQRAGPDGYVYGVTLLSLDEGLAPTWLLRIKGDFSEWQVQQVQ